MVDTYTDMDGLWSLGCFTLHPSLLLMVWHMVDTHTHWYGRSLIAGTLHTTSIFWHMVDTHTDMDGLWSLGRFTLHPSFGTWWTAHYFMGCCVSHVNPGVNHINVECYVEYYIGSQSCVGISNTMSMSGVHLEIQRIRKYTVNNKQCI